MAHVVSVNISSKKGTIKTPVEAITLNETGILGDAHAGAWHRQVSLMSTETIERFAHKAGRTMQYGEFAENITTKGIDLSKVRILDQLIIGDAVLEVTQIGKECHGSSCAIYREVGNCVMPKEGIFCRVVQPGKIQTGNELEHKHQSLKAHVITVSDRAYSGEYSDRSGPRIQQLLHDFFTHHPWRINITDCCVPDEPEDLISAFSYAVNQKADIIITSGGTGLSPRDITPNTIAPLLDYEIPGIMENIRALYGSKFPNALLSRSIAGVKNSSLVYCLPGSVKAVNEYMCEIVKNLEHSLYMRRAMKIH